MNPLQAMIDKWNGIEERRLNRHWKDGGAEVMQKSGQREWQCASGSARLRLGFEDIDWQSSLCQNDRSCEAVRAGSDHVCATLHSRDPMLVGHSTTLSSPFSSFVSTGA